MDMSRMTTEELQALLKMLAEMERQAMALLMRERREVERQGRGHRAEGLSPPVNGSSVNLATRPKRTSVFNCFSASLISNP
jgi:hypothetical protein